jgi:hypothetical protein
VSVGQKRGEEGEWEDALLPPIPPILPLLPVFALPKYRHAALPDKSAT